MYPIQLILRRGYSVFIIEISYYLTLSIATKLENCILINLGFIHGC